MVGLEPQAMPCGVADEISRVEWSTVLASPRKVKYSMGSAGKLTTLHHKQQVLPLMRERSDVR